MSVSVETAGQRFAPGTLSLSWIIGASSVGTLIEWYDFYIYGVLAAVFATHFFPAGNAFLRLLQPGRCFGSGSSCGRSALSSSVIWAI